jgi:nitrogen fixation-related uncharacterized protein
MKILYGLLVVSVAAVLASAVAMWWRLRRHLRSGEALKETANSVLPEPETVEERNLQ